MLITIPVFTAAMCSSASASKSLAELYNVILQYDVSRPFANCCLYLGFRVLALRISGDFVNLGKVYVDTSIKQLNIFILLFSNAADVHADRGNVIKPVFLLKFFRRH